MTWAWIVADRRDIARDRIQVIHLIHGRSACLRYWDQRRDPWLGVFHKEGDPWVWVEDPVTRDYAYSQLCEEVT